jgi:hypothetical protein
MHNKKFLKEEAVYHDFNESTKNRKYESGCTVTQIAFLAPNY